MNFTWVASLSFLLVLVVVSVTVIDNNNGDNLRYCNSSFDWEMGFFRSELFHALEDKGSAPKWWKGDVTPERAWTLLGAQEYLKSTPSLGNLFPLKRVFAKVEANVPVNVVVMGGSVTAGNECSIGSTWKQCAWSAQLQRILRAKGAESVNIHNAAVGGVDISVGIVQIYDRIWEKEIVGLKSEPDVFVLAFSSNDRGLIHSQFGGSMLQSFYEEIIRAIHDRHPLAAIIITSEATRDVGSSTSLNSFRISVEGYIQTVAQHYGIPMWSYKDAIWTRHVSFCMSTPDASCHNSPYHHPTSKHFASGVHAMYAYVMAFNVYQAYRHICLLDNLSITQRNTPNWRNASMCPMCDKAHLPPRKFERPDKSTWCIEPKQVIQATDPSPLNFKATNAKNWDYFADRADKFGWIATAANAHIEFPITLGKVCDALTIGYVASYTEEWGMAKFTLRVETEERSGSSEPFVHKTVNLELVPTIDARGADIGNVTITKIQFLQLRSLPDKDYHLTGANPNMRFNCGNAPAYLVVDLFRGTKFKITSISTCESVSDMSSGTSPSSSRLTVRETANNDSSVTSRPQSIVTDQSQQAPVTRRHPQQQQQQQLQEQVQEQVQQQGQQQPPLPRRRQEQRSQQQRPQQLVQNEGQQQQQQQQQRQQEQQQQHFHGAHQQPQPTPQSQKHQQQQPPQQQAQQPPKLRHVQPRNQQQVEQRQQHDLPQRQEQPPQRVLPVSKPQLTTLQK